MFLESAVDGSYSRAHSQSVQYSQTFWRCQAEEDMVGLPVVEMFRPSEV